MPMVLLARLFPTSRTAQNASRIRGRRRPKARHHPAPVAARAPSLAAEPLEQRAMLAVTASIVGGELQISLGAADDMAYLSNDGTNYIVRGTGLSGYAAAIAAVNLVTVAGTAAPGQAFTVAAGVGAVLVDPLTVAASVEQATVVGTVNTVGEVLVDSAAITLAADITTTGQQRYQGAVGLAGNRTLSAGVGNVTFGSTVDSSPTVFVDPDAFAVGTVLTDAYPGITVSNVGTSSGAVTAAVSGIPTPTTGDYGRQATVCLGIPWIGTPPVPSSRLPSLRPSHLCRSILRPMTA